MPLTPAQEAAIEAEIARRAKAAVPLTPAQQAQVQTEAAARQPSVGEDVLRSIGSGFRTGLESIPAAPQDLISLGARGINYLTGSDLSGEVPLLPSSQDIHQATTPFMGESYQPQTDLGRYARTATEFGAGSLGPGGLLRNAAIGVGAGLASEAAGQATEGTSLEPAARLVGGLAGGAAPGAVGAGVKHAVQAPGRRIEQAADTAAQRHGVALTKGERTGDVTQQMKEQQMLGGARGSWAQRLMEQRRRANLEAVKDSAQTFQDTVAPSRGQTPAESGANLNWSTRRRVDQAKRQGGAQIEGALKSGLMIDADRLRGLEADISTRLAGNTPYVPDVVLDSTTPQAAAAMERIRTFAKGAEDPNVKELSLAGAEQLRRQLGKLQAKEPADIRALGKIRDYFDDWLEAGVTDPKILADLQAGRSTYREGVQVERPRGSPPGGKQVADIAMGAHAEDTARLFAPNDRGELSATAIDALDRLISTGATPSDLSQVRGIVLDKLMTGDPGKVATRIDNFVRNNPTVAKQLFGQSELENLAAWGSTNRQLQADPKAINPSRTSYGMINELTRLASRGIPLLNMVTGPIGDAITQVRGFNAARDALKPVSRDTLGEAMLKGGGRGVAAATPGAVQGGNTITITDEADPDYGQQVEIIRAGKDGYLIRRPDGSETIIGKGLAR